MRIDRIRNRINLAVLRHPICVRVLGMHVAAMIIWGELFGADHVAYWRATWALVPGVY